MRNLITCFIIILQITSCTDPQNQIDGKWARIHWYNSTEIIGFDLSKNEFKTIDDLSIRTSFKYILEDNEIELFNELDTFRLEFRRIGNDTINFLKAKYFKLQEESLSDFEIELPKIKGYFIEHQPSSQLVLKRIGGTPKVQLGEKISDFVEIPSFFFSLKKMRLTPPKVAIDKSIKYKDLNEFYKWCFFSSQVNIRLITDADGLGSYYGFYERLLFWNEDHTSFLQQNNFPPPPPRNSREEFLKTRKNLILIEDLDNSRLNEFKSALLQAKSSIVLTINPEITINQYLKLRRNMFKIESKILDSIALNSHGVLYENLDFNKRKELRNAIGKTYIERR